MNRKRVRNGIVASCVAASIFAVGRWAVHRGYGGDVPHGRRGDWRRDGAAVPILSAVRARADRRQGGEDFGSALAYQHNGAGAGWYSVVVILLLTLPLDWLDDVLSFFGGIGQTIINAIKAGARAVVNFVVGVLSDAIRTLSGALGNLSNFVAAAWGDFSAFTFQIWAGVHQAYTDLTAFAWSVATQLANDVRSWAEGAFNAVWGFVGDLNQWTHDTFSWLEQHLLDPVWGWIERAGDFVWHVIDGWWQTVYRDVIAPAFAVFTWAAHALSSVWDWLTHDVAAAVELVARAGAWLVYMAAHDFDTLWRLLHSAPTLGGRAGQFVGQAEHAASLDLFGEYIDKVLG